MSPILDRRQMLTGGAAIAGLSLGSTAAFAQSDRIEGLIAKMTPAEKAGQLSCFSDLPNRSRGSRPVKSACCSTAWAMQAPKPRRTLRLPPG
jgi:hypothetical protein